MGYLDFRALEYNFIRSLESPRRARSKHPLDPWADDSVNSWGVIFFRFVQSVCQVVQPLNKLCGGCTMSYFYDPEALHAKSIAASSKFLGIGAIVSPCSWGPGFSVSDLQLTL